jgi:hypothetical protein
MSYFSAIGFKVTQYDTHYLWGKYFFFFYTGDFPVFCLSHWVIRAVYSTMGVGQDMKSQQLPYKRC